LTATYSCRLIILTFLSAPHFPKTILSFILDPSALMFFPLLLLSIGAAFFGFLTHEMFLGLGSTFYSQALFIHPDHQVLLDGTMSPQTWLKFLPSAILLILFTLVPLSTTFLFSNKPVVTVIFPQSFNPLTTQVTSTALIQTSSYHNFSLFSNILNHFNIFYHWVMFQVFKFAIILHRYFDRG
jgi:NADH:ubiquinone oxidoreductase subunit 5 (subunit L)/multisubunit Na+/H+ antiporter MnhA subunit